MPGIPKKRTLSPPVTRAILAGNANERPVKLLPYLVAKEDEIETAAV